jgi:uncharacterized membrane protein
MSGAHLHLLLNHFPITGGIIALVLLLGAWFRRNDALFRAALWLFVALTVLAVATYLTGEPAEHVLEELPGFSDEFVEPHEEAALWALVTYGLLGVAAVTALVAYAKRAIPRVVASALVVLALLAVGTVARVGLLGGPISHAEIRPAAVAPAAVE